MNLGRFAGILRLTLAAHTASPCDCWYHLSLVCSDDRRPCPTATNSSLVDMDDGSVMRLILTDWSLQTAEKSEVCYSASMWSIPEGGNGSTLTLTHICQIADKILASSFSFATVELEPRLGLFKLHGFFVISICHRKKKHCCASEAVQ